MDQNKKLLNKEVGYCEVKGCLLVKEYYETEVSEDQILQRIQQIDSESQNLNREIKRITEVLESKKMERAELIKYLSSSNETTKVS